MRIFEICVFCNKIKNDHGEWEHPLLFDYDLLDVDCKSTVCTECSMVKYPQFYKNEENPPPQKNHRFTQLILEKVFRKKYKPADFEPPLLGAATAS